MFRGLAVDPFYYWLKILSLFLLHLFFIIAFKFLLKFKNGLRAEEYSIYVVSIFRKLINKTWIGIRLTYKFP